MHALIYIVLALLLLPYLVLAIGLAVLGRVLAAGKLVSMLSILLNVFIVLVPWGLAALLVAISFLFALGASDRWRWAGSCLVCIAATVSVAVILLVAGSGSDLGALLFVLPCIVVVAGSAWLAATEYRTFRSAQPGVVPP